jgi:hypothetical protein
VELNSLKSLNLTKLYPNNNKNNMNNNNNKNKKNLTLTCQTSTGLDVWQVVRRVLYLRPGRLRGCVAVGSLVDAGSNLTGAWIVWKELLLKLVILCQYNSQIHRVPAGRIVTNKQQSKKLTLKALRARG